MSHADDRHRAAHQSCELQVGEPRWRPHLDALHICVISQCLQLLELTATDQNQSQSTAGKHGDCLPAAFDPRSVADGRDPRGVGEFVEVDPSLVLLRGRLGRVFTEIDTRMDEAGLAFVDLPNLFSAVTRISIDSRERPFEKARDDLTIVPSSLRESESGHADVALRLALDIEVENIFVQAPMRFEHVEVEGLLLWNVSNQSE